MKGSGWTAALLLMALSQVCVAQEQDAEQFPSATLANDQVRMKVYLPDVENGYYRGVRFDWSGVIASATYRGHEYFGLWNAQNDDPRRLSSITGPAEGYINPGLGYEEAAVGEAFLRIGIGALKKTDEEYHFRNAYEILDHGDWEIEQGEDWVSFQQEVGIDSGYAYRYNKRVRLTENGFVMEHRLDNTGSKPIDTDQFNHNFLVMDGTPTGAGFEVEFPFAPATENDLRDRAEIDGNIIRLTASHQEQGIRLVVTGYSNSVEDHQIKVTNHNTGAGVTYSIDQPLTDLVFWTNRMTLSPENSIQISVAPGESMEWTSSYRFFVE